MDLSFIILAWNSIRHLEKCIGSVEHAMAQSRFSYEVRVFENGSRDQTPGLLKCLADRRPDVVIPHFEASNIGTTRSRNRLFTAAKGDLLCVMDSDVEIAAGVLETLMPHIRSDFSLGIVAPRILYPNGKWQKSFDRFPTIVDKINRFVRLRSIETTESQRFDKVLKPFYVDYAISAFWLMRRDLLEKVGLLDERIFYSPEDVDFCLRVWKSGHRILYVPTVCVVHHTQEISRGLSINKSKLSHIKGLCYYFFKHRYILRRPQMAH